jgi:cysteine synthase B
VEPLPRVASGGAAAAPSPSTVVGRTPGTAELLAAIGNTPLVEISDLSGSPGVRIFAKLESSNPGGSIKDRPVARMMLRALDDGRFARGERLLDSSSGNAGIAYSMLGAALGVPVTLVVPGNASRERLDRIRAHGAELVLTDPAEGYDFALREARRLALGRPDLYWHCDQYSNQENVRAHHEGTGREILEQVEAKTGGAPDAFVGGVGTGGTITGVGRRLRGANPRVHLAVVIPETFPGIEGLKPLGSPGDLVPEILDESLVSERIPVTVEQAVAATRTLARLGFFVGPSSGAYVHGAIALSSRGGFRTIVTILNDGGDRYGSTGLWSGGGASA